MLTSGGSSFATFVFWLIAAGLVSLAAIVAVGVVWRTRGFRQRSRRRSVAIALMLASLVCWAGFRVTSNAWWAAWSVASEVSSVFPDDVWDVRERPGLRSNRIDGCDTRGVWGSVRLKSTTNADTQVHLVSSSLLSDYLAQYEKAAQELEAKGYEVTRSLRFHESPRFQMLAIDGDRRAHIGVGRRFVLIAASASNPCDAVEPDTMDDFEFIGEVAEFSVEAVCADFSELLAACSG